MIIIYKSHTLIMNSTFGKNKSCFSPSKYRILFFLADFLLCWGAVFYKARAAESSPWSALLIVTFFILGILGFEVLMSSRFPEYLVPAIYGFLLGAGINVIIQALLNKFQGINWTFQSPVLFSLGTLLLGFLGSMIFVSYREHINKIIPRILSLKRHPKTQKKSRQFSVVIWVITAAAALGLCINLMMIMKFFKSTQTDNPLRKPLWFSVGAIIVIFMAAAFIRKYEAVILSALIPGIITGLIWASVFRDMWEWVYLKHPEFPLSSDILEFLLILNFCYLGTAWLNKAFDNPCQKTKEGKL